MIRKREIAYYIYCAVILCTAGYYLLNDKNSSVFFISTTLLLATVLFPGIRISLNTLTTGLKEFRKNIDNASVSWINERIKEGKYGFVKHLPLISFLLQILAFLIYWFIFIFVVLYVFLSLVLIVLGKSILLAIACIALMALLAYIAIRILAMGKYLFFRKNHLLAGIVASVPEESILDPSTEHFERFFKYLSKVPNSIYWYSDHQDTNLQTTYVYLIECSRNSTSILSGNVHQIFTSLKERKYSSLIYRLDDLDKKLQNIAKKAHQQVIELIQSKFDMTGRFTVFKLHSQLRKRKTSHKMKQTVTSTFAKWSENPITIAFIFVAITLLLGIHSDTATNLICSHAPDPEGCVHIFDRLDVSMPQMNVTLNSSNLTNVTMQIEYVEISPINFTQNMSNVTNLTNSSLIFLNNINNSN